MADSIGRKWAPHVSSGIFALANLGFALGRQMLLWTIPFIGYGLYQSDYRAVGTAQVADFVPDRLQASGPGW